MEMIKVTQAQKETLLKKCDDCQLDLQHALEDRERARSSDGDKSENTSLDIAEQAVTDAEHALQNAQDRYKSAVVVESINTDVVGILTHVRLRNVANSQEREISIVDDGQGFPPMHVSARSKMGAAVLGKRVGEAFRYQDNVFNVHEFMVLSISSDV